VAHGTVAHAEDLDDRRLLLGGLAISGGILAGMFLGSGILVGLAVLSAFVAGLSFPALGLVVLAVMGPLKPPPVVPAPGFNLVLVAAILLGCVYQLPISRTSLHPRAPLLLLSAFVFYAFVQQLPDMASGYAGVQSHDIGYLFFQLLTGFGALVAAGFVLRGRSPYPFLVALLISGTFAAILAILTANGVRDARLANLIPTPDVASRATGPFGNPNSFGQLVAYAGALAAAWLVGTQSRRLRSLLLLSFGIMAYALSLSLSRGGAATLLAGLVALAFARSRTLGFAAAGAALILVIVGYPMFVEWRLATEGGPGSSAAAAALAASDEGRLGAILAAPALFASSPIFGIGFGQYKYMSALVTDQGAGLAAHNWYGTVLAEQGVAGILLWLLMLVAVGVWLRSRPARPRSIGLAMFGAVVVGCLFLEPPTSFQTSVLPIIVLTGALVGQWGGRIAATGKEGSRMPAGAAHRPATIRRPADVAGPG
jgi:O-antigen ligase